MVQNFFQVEKLRESEVIGQNMCHLSQKTATQRFLWTIHRFKDLIPFANAAHRRSSTWVAVMTEAFDNSIIDMRCTPLCNLLSIQEKLANVCQKEEFISLGSMRGIDLL